MPPLALTDHAIDRFISRWRPGFAITQAQAELITLAQRATATRRRTLTGDAQVYISESATGERIALAVRDNMVITVLPADAGEGQDCGAILPDFDALRDSQDTVAACQAILAEEARQKQEDEYRRRAAEATLRRWKVEGRKYTTEVLRAAHDVLGLPYEVPKPFQPAPGEASVEVEHSRHVNATILIKEWQAGRDHSVKALRRAHETLGLPFTPEAKSQAEADRLNSARLLVKEWEAGRSIASPKAARRAYALLWLPFVSRRQGVR